MKHEIETMISALKAVAASLREIKYDLNAELVESVITKLEAMKNLNLEWSSQ